MINTWLRLPAPGLFAVLIVAYGSTGFLWAWLSFRSPLSQRVHSLTGVVPPFIAAVGILFSLLTGFLANDIADRNRLATRAVNAEASAITSVNTLSIATATDMADLRSALWAYAEAVVTDEWPKLAQDLHSARTDQAMYELLRKASDSTITRDAGQAVQNNLLRAVMNIRDARADRLSLASDHTNSLKWAIVLLLAMFTQLTIALVHLDRPRPQAAALAVFSLATVIALGLIALQEHPFKGALRVSPAPLLKSISMIAPT